MALQTVIGPQALKSFTKTLTCLSRYGDDVILQATSDALFLSATNSSKSAFFRVKFTSQYFDKYRLKAPAQPGMSFQTPPEVDVTGQLLVKSLLSILKHKTVEQTVDRCDLSIIEGGQDSTDLNTTDISDEDSLSSKLILRLHCKHGVVKTHRLLLFTPNTLIAPRISDPSSSQITVGPRTLRDILDHFPHSRGDPQLAWNFAANDVVLRSIETARARDRGATQLATEISLSADEFDVYTIAEPPVSISFHLREFNATIALAESLCVALDMQFTSPAEPLIITFDTEAADAEYLFVIATTSKETGGGTNPRKRGRGDDSGNVGVVAAKKPLRAAVNTASVSASQRAPPPRRTSPVQQPSDTTADERASQSSGNQAPPLFLPGASQDAAPPPPASQLSAAALALVSSAGLGIEHMDYEEFEAMMEADGEEVGMSTEVRRTTDDARRGATHGGGHTVGTDSDERHDWAYDADEADDGEDLQMMGASQAPAGKFGNKEFRPLFDD